jgi:hypothetical protein
MKMSTATNQGEAAKGGENSQGILGEGRRHDICITDALLACLTDSNAEPFRLQGLPR